MLEGGIDIDDVLLGRETSGTPARGSENKISFVVAVQIIDDGRPTFASLKPLAITKAVIERWANRALAAFSIVVSDSMNCFDGLKRTVACHEARIVSSGCHAVKHPAFNRVFTQLSNLKITISGTHRA